MNVNFILPQDRDEGRQRPTIFAAAVFFLLAASGQVLISGILYPINLLIIKIAPDVEPVVLDYLMQLMYYMLFIILPITLYIQKRPDELDAMRLNQLKVGDALLSVLAAMAGVMCVMYIGFLWSMLIEALGGVIPASGITVPTTTNGLIASILFVAVMPGVCEEVLFRGAILSAWEERGTRRAVIISSLLFAFLHSSIAGLPTQILLGIVIAYIVVSTGSLIAGMIYHTVHNAMLMILAYSASVIEVSEQEAALSAYEQIGGAVGIVSIFVNIALFGSILILILRQIKRRRVARGARAFGIEAPDKKRDLGWCELGLICAGLLVIIMLYIIDVLRIAGYFV